MTPTTPTTPITTDSTEPASPAWDAIAVRDLVRAAQGLRDQPAELVLGRAEAGALHAFLQDQYGDEAPASLRSSYYLGLKVRVEDVASRLAVAGSKPPVPLDGRLAPLWSDDPGQRNRAA